MPGKLVCDFNGVATAMYDQGLMPFACLYRPVMYCDLCDI